MKNKKKAHVEHRLSKVIYFDENSATDYVQMIEGGQLTQTTELLETDGNSGSSSADANASIGFGKLFKSLVGFGASASVNANLKMNFQSDNLVRNILQNTILTDFLSIVNKAESSGGARGIEVLDGYKIEVAQDSLSYIIMVSPFLAMLKDSSIINQGSNLDFDIDIEKIDSAIKMAKGYYELLGSKNDSSKIVVRFNIDSFKNNYRISDLPMMELVFFAIKVGKTSINKMAIEDAISASVAIISDKPQIDNPLFPIDSNCETEEHEENVDLDVYDVLLAGVREV